MHCTVTGVKHYSAAAVMGMAWSIYNSWIKNFVVIFQPEKFHPTEVSPLYGTVWLWCPDQILTLSCLYVCAACWYYYCRAFHGRAQTSWTAPQHHQYQKLNQFSASSVSGSAHYGISSLLFLFHWHCGASVSMWWKVWLEFWPSCVCVCIFVAGKSGRLWEFSTHS